MLHSNGTESAHTHATPQIRALCIVHCVEIETQASPLRSVWLIQTWRHCASLGGHVGTSTCSTVFAMQGAAFWDWTQDGIDTSASVPVQLDLDSDSFALTAAEKGISNDKAVVCYDSGSGGSMFALRVRWALRCHGHPRAFVLEGGWQAWLDAGGEVSLHEPCPLSVRPC